MATRGWARGWPTVAAALCLLAGLTGARAAGEFGPNPTPFQLDHAGDAVVWRTWSGATVATARAAGRPVLLSVGFHGCPGCERMETESFRDAAVARLLNERYTPVLLDAEAEPEVARQYAALAVRLGAPDAYPLSLLLSPELAPLAAFGYQSPTDFQVALTRVADAWAKDPAGLAKAGADALAGLSRILAPAPATTTDATAPDAAALAALKAAYDRDHGGFGQGAKDVPVSELGYLLRGLVGRRDPVARKMVTQTLDALTGSPVWDRAGGVYAGSADPAWRVPRREKLLTDNAQLAVVLLDAWRVLGDERYRALARRTLDAVTAQAQPDGALAARQGSPVVEADAAGAGIAALALAAQRLNVSACAAVAERAAEATERRLRRDGRWWHDEAGHPAGIDDLAQLAVGLMDLYEATFELRWLTKARELVAQAEATLGGQGGYRRLPDYPGGPPLPERRAVDGRLPAGNAVMIEALARLGRWTEDEALTVRAQQVAAAFAAEAWQAPAEHLGRLRSVRWLSPNVPAVCVVGSGASADELTRLAWAAPLPERVLARLDPDGPEAEATVALIRLLAERGPGSRGARAYVCTEATCLRPAETPELLVRQLNDLATRVAAPDS